MRVLRACAIVFAAALELAWHDIRAAAASSSMSVATLPGAFATSALACLTPILTAGGESATISDISVSGQALQHSLPDSCEPAIPLDQLIVTKVEKVSEKRFDGNVFEYAFRVTIKNTGRREAVDVTARVTNSLVGTELVDTAASTERIASGATATSADLIILRRDRRRTFHTSELKWEILDKTSKQLNDLQPAENYAFSLSELNIPDTAHSVVASGAVGAVLLKGGMLRFTTLGDSGSDQEARFVVKADGETIILDAQIISERPTAASIQNELPEYMVGEQPELKISGFGPDNNVTGSELKFKLIGAAHLKVQENSDVLVLANDNSALSLKKYWTYDEADASFSIAGEALQQLMGVLHVGALVFFPNFETDDYKFSWHYGFLAMNARTTIKGRYVSADGANATWLVGKNVLLKGATDRVRKVASIDANGAFEFRSIIPDTYVLRLSDLENPDVLTTAIIIYPDSTEVRMTIVCPVKNGPPASTKDVSAVTDSSTQNGTPPPVPSRRRASAEAAVSVPRRP